MAAAAKTRRPAAWRWSGGCGWVMSRDCWIIERLSRVRRYGVLRSLSPACQDNGRGPRAGGPGKHPSVLLCSGEARILAEFHVPAHWHFLQGPYDRPIVSVTLYVRHSDVSWDIHYGKRSFYCVKLYCVHCDCYDHYYSVSQKKKQDTMLLSVTPPNVNLFWFSKHFYC